MCDNKSPEISSLFLKMMQRSGENARCWPPFLFLLNEPQKTTSAIKSEHVQRRMFRYEDLKALMGGDFWYFSSVRLKKNFIFYWICQIIQAKQALGNNYSNNLLEWNVEDSMFKCP